MFQASFLFLSSERKTNFANETSVLEAKTPNLKTSSPMKEVTFFLLSKVLKLRLAGAAISNAGRVQVLYAGKWGTIRGRNWDINAAHVVCRQLGYPGAISFGSSNQFGIGNGPSWFENVRCLVMNPVLKNVQKIPWSIRMATTRHWQRCCVNPNPSKVRLV